MKLRDSSGQTLIEIAIGMTILSVVLLGATSAAISGSQQGINSYIDLLGSEYAQEGIEQITLYRNYCAKISYTGSCVAIKNWAASGSTSYRTLDASGWNEGSWILSSTLGSPPTTPNLSSTEEPFSPARFTRYIKFTDVTDPALGSGIVEWEAKVLVTWPDADGNTRSESGSTILSNWNGG